jgi:nicotinamide-nucleotide amidase
MLSSTTAKAIILSQGDEVITGALVDSNAAFLADHCRTLGFDIVRHITVADDMAELVQVLQDIDGMADVCLCTGGLGPTQDDLTTEAFSKAFNVDLVLDDVALKMMSDFFAKLNMTMAAVNHKQALLPKDSTRIDNHWGTAAGFMGLGQRCRFYFMPGVPFEMKQMMDAFVLNDLREQFNIEPSRLITFRSIGMGESDIQQAVNEMNIDPDIRISFRAGLPENELKLLFPNTYSDQQIKHYIDDIEAVMRGSVFAVDGFNQTVSGLADCVDQLMREKKQSLSVIETISQGGLAAQCHADWLVKSVVIPQRSGIMSRLDSEPLYTDESIAIKLAQKEHAKHTAELTLVQLFETDDDAGVNVYTAIMGAQYPLSSSKTVRGRPQRQQIVAAAMALNLLRKYLLGL